MILEVIQFRYCSSLIPHSNVCMKKEYDAFIAMQNYCGEHLSVSFADRRNQSRIVAIQSDRLPLPLLTTFGTTGSPLLQSN